MSHLSSLRAAALALLLCAPALASAVSLADGKLHINANGQWSFQATSRANTSYLEGDTDGDWQTAMFDLLTVARPTDDLTINAQAGFEGESVELEWAFLEWRLDDALRLRAGRVKQPFGNYAEIQFVGTARPFYDLPTGIYGPAAIVAEAYSGLGLTGDFHLGAYTLQYDLWGGAMEMASFEPYDFFNGEIVADAPPPVVDEAKVENIVGARASLLLPSGWTFRLSSWGGRSEADEEEVMTIVTGGASAWYRGEKLWLSAEAFYTREGTEESTTAGYLEAGWFLTEKVQVAGRYEISRSDVKGLKTSDALVRHDGWTAGASYWITPGAVLRASVDYVKGSRFLRNETWDDLAEEGGLLAYPAARPVGETFRFVVGTQFTF